MRSAVGCAVSGGRPLKYATPAKLQKAITAYFADCRASGEIPRVTELALALGGSRQTLVNYANRPKYAAIVETAKARCEDALLAAARDGRIPVALGIFELKNFGWSDKHEVAVDAAVTVSWTPRFDDGNGDASAISNHRLS